jgi:AraC-like DNA-binding protein
MRITGRANEAAQYAGTLEKALDYILHSPMATTLSVNDLAVRLNMDRTTLFRYFIKQYGVAPKTYLDEVRLEKAIDLLSNTRLHAREIAYECGFSGPCYFNRVFKKAYGMSPGKWRKQD